MSNAFESRLLLVLTALLFSSGGAAIKLTSLSSWQVSAFRSAIGAATLFLLLPQTRRNWSGKVLAAALSYAGTLVLFVLANKLTTSANAIFLQSTAPIYVVLLSPWMLQERVNRRDIFVMLAIAIGLFLFFASPEQASRTAPDPFHGNIIAAFSGITWALTLISLRALARKGETGGAAQATAAWGNVFACLICLPLAVPVHSSTSVDWLVVSFLGIFGIGFAYICLTRGIRHVPAIESATILLLEPALNPLWSWLVHGERPGVFPLCGGALILGATVIKMRVDAVAPSRST